MVKNLPASIGEKGVTGSIPGSGRFPGEGNGNPLQYSCLENSMNQRSLAGYSSSGCKELNVFFFTAFAFVSVFTSGISFEHYTGR